MNRTKSIFLFFLLVSNSIILIAQTTFQKGYYIDNTGQKIEGLIKNYDWFNNPDEFEFRISKDDQTKILQIKDIKVVHVDNHTYERFEVLMDESKSNLNQLSYSKAPDLVKRTLFLKLIFDGNDADLYEYTKKGLMLFFFKHKKSKIKQLIYKKYFDQERNGVAENTEFRQQIWQNLKCKSITLEKIRKLKYDRKILVKLFANYNNCLGYKNNTISNKRSPKEIFNLSIKPRYNTASLSIDKGAPSILSVRRELDFDNNNSFSLGIELEYILPFNNNKWALFIEPNYQSFNDEEILLYESGFQSTNFILNYETIDLPIGLRHYMFLNTKSKLFMNISAHFNIDLEGSVYDENNRFSDELDVKSSPYFSIGLGYNYNDIFNLELRSSLAKNIISSAFWTSDYQVFSFILGYTIF